jgi:hypothetical protein
MRIDSPASAGTHDSLEARLEGSNSVTHPSIGNYVSNYFSNTVGSMYSTVRNTAVMALGGLALLLGISTMAGCPTTTPSDDDDDTTDYQDDDDTADDDDDTTGDDDDTTDPDSLQYLGITYEIERANGDIEEVKQSQDDPDQLPVYEGDRAIVTVQYKDPTSPAVTDVSVVTIGDQTIDVGNIVSLNNYDDCTTGGSGASSCSANTLEDGQFQVAKYDDNLYRIVFANTLNANVLDDGKLKASIVIDYDDNTSEVELDEEDNLTVRAYPGLEGGITLDYVVNSPTAASVPYAGTDVTVSKVSGPIWITPYVDGNEIDLTATAPDNSFNDCSQDSPCQLELEIEDDEGFVDNGSYSVVVSPAGTLSIATTVMEMGEAKASASGETVNADCNGNTQSGVTDGSGHVDIPLNETGLCEITVNGTSYLAEVTASQGTTNLNVEVYENNPTDPAINSCFDGFAPDDYNLLLQGHGFADGAFDLGNRTLMRYEAGPLSGPIKYFVSNIHDNGTTLTTQQHQDLIAAAEEGEAIVDANSHGVDYLVRTEDVGQAVITVVESDETNPDRHIDPVTNLVYAADIELHDYSGRDMAEEFVNVLGVVDFAGCGYYVTNGWTELGQEEEDLLYFIHNGLDQNGPELNNTDN